MKFGNLTKGILMLLMLAGLSFAVASSQNASNIKTGLCSLLVLINNLLAVVIFILIVGAAIVYAGGQLLGAETRARATVWATSMFMGSIIGVVIYIIVPYVLGIMLGGSVTGSMAC